PPPPRPCNRHGPRGPSTRGGLCRLHDGPPVHLRELKPVQLAEWQRLLLAFGHPPQWLESPAAHRGQRSFGERGRNAAAVGNGCIDYPTLDVDDDPHCHAYG